MVPPTVCGAIITGSVREAPMNNTRLAEALILGALLTAGCSTYYRVSDPTSGRTYFTDEIKRRDDGTLQFRDGKSGAAVTLRASEVLEISKEEFQKNTMKTP
jgi:hypothetical protein